VRNPNPEAHSGRFLNANLSRYLLTPPPLEAVEVVEVEVTRVLLDDPPPLLDPLNDEL
jgi:hypothetical protein